MSEAVFKSARSSNSMDEDNEIRWAALRLCELKVPIHPIHPRPPSEGNDPSPSSTERDVHFDLDEEEDKYNVNQLHQFVRSDLLEVFVVPTPLESKSDEDDISHEPPSSPKGDSGGQLSPNQSSMPKQRAYPGRVGLRCKYCKPSSKKGLKVRCSNRATKMATVFPVSVKNIYRAVCRFQTTHFLHCQAVPESDRLKYMALKNDDKSRGNKKYWVASALRKGLIDNPDGGEGIVLKKMTGDDARNHFRRHFF